MEQFSWNPGTWSRCATGRRRAVRSTHAHTVSVAFPDHLWVLFPDVMMVLASEVAVDVVKHAFITKFNDISADVSASCRPHAPKRCSSVGFIRDSRQGSVLELNLSSLIVFPRADLS